MARSTRRSASCWCGSSSRRSATRGSRSVARRRRGFRDRLQAEERILTSVLRRLGATSPVVR